MASNRIGGPSPSDPNKGPDTRMQEQHRKVEKVEKVKAVDETENEHTRKKFQRFMSDEEMIEKPRMPSPLETGFYKDEETVFIDPSKTFEDVENNPIPSPSYSPRPNLNQPTESFHDENPPLPKSHDFWNQVDTDSNTPPPHPQLAETKKRPLHPSSNKNKKKEVAPFPGKTDSLYGPPGKTTEKNETHHKGKAKPHEKTGPIASAPSPINPQSEKEKKLLPKEMEKERKKSLSPLPHNMPSSHKKSSDQESDEEKGKNKTPLIQIESLPLEQIPSSVIPMTETATLQASPYLNSETTPLFFQMVGTIYVITAPPGISKTEIVLNSPAFANSKFFGATISIEKYATAPDSLNIRLTGTNEAVKTFNENLSNLYGAFQNGNFGFRIGRISAEYSIDRPIFRRKEPGEGRRESGGDMSQERGKR